MYPPNSRQRAHHPFQLSGYSQRYRRTQHPPILTVLRPVPISAPCFKGLLSLISKIMFPAMLLFSLCLELPAMLLISSSPLCPLWLKIISRVQLRMDVCKGHLVFASINFTTVITSNNVRCSNLWAFALVWWILSILVVIGLIYLISNIITNILNIHHKRANAQRLKQLTLSEVITAAKLMLGKAR